jgi:hypothetical protein
MYISKRSSCPPYSRMWWLSCVKFALS